MKTCSFDGCDKPVHVLEKGLCCGHYAQQRKGKTLKPLRVPQYVCSFEGCDKPHEGRGYCQGHNKQIEQGKQLTPLTHYGSGDEISYVGAHYRVYRSRGRAKDHSCVDCGATAFSWSYSHKDPNERSQLKEFPRGKVREVAFSPNPDFYDPRCRSCHKNFDSVKSR